MNSVDIAGQGDLPWTQYNNEGACQWYFKHSVKLFYKTGPTDITLKDEFQFRLDLLDSERHRAVLAKCAQQAEWGRRLPARRFPLNETEHLTEIRPG